MTGRRWPIRFGLRRTIWPTRDGWWCLGVALGLGVAAVNTGNNLVYLLCSMLLAVILVSGALSEQTMRGLRLALAPPAETYAGRPALFGATVANRKRRLPSYSITLETPGADGGRRFFHLPRLPAGAERVLTWQATLPVRGRHRVPGPRVSTRFPFGLFVKTEPTAAGAEVLVYPAVEPVSPDRLRRHAGLGPTPARRRGRGEDLYNLRQYRPGDDPRQIHWRSSAKAQALTVRELEEDGARDVRLLLTGDGRGDPARLEAGLSEAASLAVHLLRTGAGVEVRGAGVVVPLGRGRAQETRILTALALYEPGASGGAAAPSAPAALPEIRVGLG